MTIDFEAKALDLVLGWLTEDIDKGLDIIRSQTLSASLVPRVAKWGRSIAKRARDEAMGEAADYIIENVRVFGNDHDYDCPVATDMNADCVCYLTDHARAIRALKEKP